VLLLLPVPLLCSALHAIPALLSLLWWVVAASAAVADTVRQGLLSLLLGSATPALAWPALALLPAPLVALDWLHLALLEALLLVGVGATLAAGQPLAAPLRTLLDVARVTAAAPSGAAAAAAAAALAPALLIPLGGGLGGVAGVRTGVPLLQAWLTDGGAQAAAAELSSRSSSGIGGEDEEEQTAPPVSAGQVAAAAAAAVAAATAAAASSVGDLDGESAAASEDEDADEEGAGEAADEGEGGALRLSAEYQGMVDAMVAEYLARYCGEGGGGASPVGATAPPLVWDEQGSWPGLGCVHKARGLALCFKSHQRLPNSAAACFTLITDTPNRKQWDTTCDSIQVVEVLDAWTSIVHYRAIAVWPTAQRELVLLSHRRVLADGRLLNVSQSVQHPAVPEPSAASGIIRGVMDVAGAILVPADNGRDECDMINVTNLDPKGNIPEWVVKLSTNKKTPAGMKILRELCGALAPLKEYTPPTLPQRAPPAACRQRRAGGGGNGGGNGGSGGVTPRRRGGATPAKAPQSRRRLAEQPVAPMAGFEPRGAQQPALYSFEHVRQVLEEHQPFIVAGVAALALINSLRSGRPVRR
jgi:hypothetical protein